MKTPLFQVAYHLACALSVPVDPWAGRIDLLLRRRKHYRHLAWSWRPVAASVVKWRNGGAA